MTTTIANRVISYFFIFDFYHGKGSTDEVDLLPESIIYFYSPKEDLKRQKLLDCGEIVGLIQFFKNDLFLCMPTEFNFKRSLVTCKHYGRHCAFLVLSKDRFTTDEANIHLTHILQLFNMLYGTLNHIQSIHLDINQIELYLKQTLTPIMEYIFNENRSIQNLFSAINYAPLKNNNGRYLLHIKHLLNHLKSRYGIKDGFFACEKRVLYSTLDIDTTFYLQVILGLEKNLPANEINISLGSETKLKNGVSLIRIYIRPSPSLQPILNPVKTNTMHYSNPQTLSDPIDIIKPLLTNGNETSSLNFHSNTMNYSLSTSDQNYYNSIMKEDPDSSSDGTADFDTVQTERLSPISKTDTNSVEASFNDKTFIPIAQFLKDKSNLIFSPKSPDGLRTDDDKIRFQFERSRSTMSDIDYENSSKADRDISRLDDSKSVRLVFEPIENDSYESDCREEDIICLPPMSSFSNIYRGRQKTITSHSDLNDVEYSGGEHQEGHVKWGDIPEKNDEVELNEFVLYIQRNSRMLFAGIMEKNLLSQEYLQKMWCLMLTEMADMDREIQVIPIAGETSKYNTDIKFQFNENTRQSQFERLLVGNRYYYKTPSADSACMAFYARTKLNSNPERKMIGLSRGNNLISVNQILPDRVTYSCRRFQESK